MAEPTFENALKAMKIALEQGDQTKAKRMAQLAKSLEPKREYQGTLPLINKGIAQTVGGVVDFLNPLDNLGITGSAVTGIENLMKSGGIKLAEEKPEGFLENFMYGTGGAAGAVLPIAKGAQVISKGGNIVGKAAQDAYRSMLTKGGVTSELAAGGLSRAASSEAEKRGYSQPIQDLAGLAGGLGGGVTQMGLSSAGRQFMSSAPGKVIGSGAEAIRGIVDPFTKAGGTRIAREKFKEFAGGEDRASQLANLISKESTELNLTPAQQIGDPKLLQLEKAAMKSDPKLRERITRQRTESRELGLKQSDIGGDIRVTQEFLQARQKEVFDNLDNVIFRATENAKKNMPRVGMSETQASRVVSDEIIKAETAALKTEKELWGQVPTGVKINALESKDVARQLKENTVWAQKSDIPFEVNSFLKQKDTQSVAEMIGLYSKLRETARNAMSGTSKQKNTARIANTVAEAILKDFDNASVSGDVGVKIANARIFSRGMHEKFSRGTVGKLLKRSVDGGQDIDAELALQASMGSGGSKAFVAQRDIDIATSTPETKNATADFLKSKFNEVAFTGDRFNENSTINFLQKNIELINKFPTVKAEIETAIKAQKKLTRASEQTTMFKKAIESSVGGKLVNAQPNRSLEAIITSRYPAKEFAKLLVQVKKDKTGQSLEGLKKAVSNKLIGDNITGANMKAMLSDKEMGSIAKQVYSKSEYNRLKTISAELTKLDAAESVKNVDSTLAKIESNNILSTVARIAGAKVGAVFGDGNAGASLQAAQIGASRAAAIVSKLTNDTARKLMMDAIEDAELFRSLLTDINIPSNYNKAQKTLAPYLVGASSTIIADGQE